MLLRRRANAETEPATPIVIHPAAMTDAETGLGNERMLDEILRREIARSQRYGDRSALCVFDVVEAVMPGDSRPSPGSSPARFVAAILRDAAREADVIFRVGPRHFAALLTESDQPGARNFCERVRTKVSSTPYARREDGTAVYARAWAGGVAWNPELATPGQYLDAAAADLEATRPGYELEASWFSGIWGTA